MELVTALYTDPPRIEIVMTGMPSSTVSVRVGRMARGQAWWLRGTRNISGTSGLVMDWEAPCGVATQYRVEALGSDGNAIDAGTTDPVMLPDVPAGFGWVSDPLDQTSPMLVELTGGTDPERSYPAAVDQSVTSMSGHSRLSIGMRQLLPSWTFVAHLGDPSAREQFRDLIISSTVLLVRLEAATQLPPLIYGAPPDPKETWKQIHDRSSTWNIQLLTSGGPALDAIVAAWTYSDLAGTGLSYAGLPTVWQTYIDLKRGPVD